MWIWSFGKFGNSFKSVDSREYGNFCESSGSGDIGVSNDSDQFVDFGDSCKLGDPSNSEERGDLGEFDDSGSLVILVDLVIL